MPVRFSLSEGLFSANVGNIVTTPCMPHKFQMIMAAILYVEAGLKYIKFVAYRSKGRHISGLTALSFPESSEQ